MALADRLRRRLGDALGNADDANTLANAIDSISLADGAVTAAKLAAQSVTMPKLARGTNGQLIIGQTGADPAYTSVTGDVTITQAGVTAIGAQKVSMAMLVRGTNGQLIIGQNGANPAYTDVTGDVTIGFTGATAIGAQKVLMAMLVRGTNGQLIVGQTGADPAYKTVSGDVTIDADGVASLRAGLGNLVVLIPIENLAANTGFSSRPMAAFPFAGTLISAAILAQGTFAGVDASHTIEFDLRDGSNNLIVAKLFSDAPAPVDNGVNDLGALDVTNKVLTADETVLLTIISGTTADPPALLLRLEFRPT